MKQCNKCLLFLELEDFHKDRHKKAGLAGICKKCKKDTAKLNKKDYLVCVKDKHCPICKIVKSSDNFHKNKSNKTGLAWECKECRIIKCSISYQKNKEKVKKRTKQYYNDNREKIRKSKLVYQTKKLKTDKIFKLTRNLRNRLYYALKNKGWEKNTHFNEYIGCDYDTLIKHLESKFKPGMTWENHTTDGWHIDHIIPLNSAKTEEELYKLCHYTNLQPLWAEENYQKCSKLY